jgi:SAM-dependent methyltransferase
MASDDLAAETEARAPDEAVRAASIAKYRRRAARYDRTCGPTWPIRERAIAALCLQPGQRVLDVGCGTGLSLALLRERVGDTGRVYGIDQSPEMAERARARIVEHGWRNVELALTPAQLARLPETVDAILFHYTHDILRSPIAVRNLLSLARPGAMVAIAGVKYFPAWLAPMNLWVYLKNAAYNGAPGQLRAPWSIAARFIPELRVTPTQFGMGYIATGRLTRPPPGPVGAATAPFDPPAPRPVASTGATLTTS